MEQKINTPAEMPETTILAQKANYIKARSQYSNGLIIISEVSDGSATISSNYNWILEKDNSLTPNMSSRNQSFIDD